MTEPDAKRLYAAIDATWPPSAFHRDSNWLYREGFGGGKRVSATTARAQAALTCISDAEVSMSRMGQDHLFMLRAEDADLDRQLEAQGYEVIDPVNLYLAPIRDLAVPRPKRLSALSAWPPLAVMREIWAEGGIGADRVRVMERARGAKSGFLARANDRPAGAAFVALDQNIAMIHSIEVRSDQRRQGVGGNILREAAHWAQHRGADWMALAVTRSNHGANQLYSSLGMKIVGHYHYRIKTSETGAEQT